MTSSGVVVTTLKLALVVTVVVNYKNKKRFIYLLKGNIEIKE